MLVLTRFFANCYPMRKNRSAIILTDRPAVYHCTNRCVRQAFLLNPDSQTHEEFLVRKQWLRTKAQSLSAAFTSEVFSFSLMDNHYHIILEMDPVNPAEWSRTEVAERW